MAATAELPYPTLTSLKSGKVDKIFEKFETNFIIT